MQLSQSFSIQILGFKVSGLRCTDRDINSQRGCLASSKRDKHLDGAKFQTICCMQTVHFLSPLQFTISMF